MKRLFLKIYILANRGIEMNYLFNEFLIKRLLIIYSKNIA